MTHPQAVKSLTAGRVVVVDTTEHRNTLGVVLKVSSTSGTDKSYTMLVLCEQNVPSHSQQEMSSSDTSCSCDNSDWTLPRPVIAMPLFRPEGQCGSKTIDTKSYEISAITVKTLKINADRIIDDIKKRQIPRFK